MIITKQKVRHWIYTGIFLALLGYGAWFLLMRPSGLDQNALQTIYAEQQSSYEAVGTYLSGKNYHTEITHIPTIDEDFGIRGEDKPEYRAFNDGIIRLYEKNLDKIICKDGNVVFYLQAEGGLLVQQYAVLSYQKEGTAGTVYLGDNLTAEKMSAEHWYGCIADGKP